METKHHAAGKPTNRPDYTDGLIFRQSAWWKKLFNVQYPYKWNINRLKPGFVLDVGCGIGRNLLHLNGTGVGVDHNPTSVAVCKSRGLTAFTVDELMKSEYNVPGRFDTILLAHVAEHMAAADVVNIINQYSYLLKIRGRIIIITPQESGFRSDDTHVEFMDFGKISAILSQTGNSTVRQYSFPFPRFAGPVFKYNEFISIGRKQE